MRTAAPWRRGETEEQEEERLRGSASRACGTAWASAASETTRAWSGAPTMT